MSGIRTMGKVPKPEFTRRINEDWSIHSYCSQCFATIVDASSPAQVESAEREHHWILDCWKWSSATDRYAIFVRWHSD